MMRKHVGEKAHSCKQYNCLKVDLVSSVWPPAPSKISLTILKVVIHILKAFVPAELLKNNF